MTPGRWRVAGVCTKGTHLVAKTAVPLARDAQQVAALLNCPEIVELITDLQAVYALATWTRTVRLVADHSSLREPIGATPTVHAA